MRSAVILLFILIGSLGYYNVDIGLNGVKNSGIIRSSQATHIYNSDMTTRDYLRSRNPKSETYARSYSLHRDNIQGEWFYNETITLWSMFGGGDIKFIGYANTSTWGKIIVFILDYAIELITIENISDIIMVTYVYQKIYDLPIVGHYIGDIDADGWDEIVIAYGNTIEIVGEYISEGLTGIENITGMTCANIDGDEYLEYVITTSFPRARIYEHDFSLISVESLPTGFDEFKVLATDTDNDGYDEAIIVRNDHDNMRVNILKLESSGAVEINETIENALCTDAYIARTSMPGEYVRLVMSINTIAGYEVSAYNITYDTLDEVWYHSHMDPISSLLVFDITAGYPGDEVFVSTNNTIIGYRSDTGEEVYYLSGESYNIVSLCGFYFNETKRGLIYSLDYKEIVILNDSFNEINRTQVTDTYVDMIYSTNIFLGYPYEIITCDISNIGTVVTINGSAIVQKKDFLVAGSIGYARYLREYSYYFVAGKIPYIMGISCNGTIIWSHRISGEVYRVAYWDNGETFFVVGDDSGNVYLVGAQGEILGTYDILNVTYGIAIWDLDNDGDIETALGTYQYIMILDEGEIIKTTNLNDIVTCISLVDYDGDEYLDICAGLHSGKIAIYEYNGSSIVEQDAQNLPEGFIPIFSATGDYNGDGRFDSVLVVGNFSYTKIYTVDISYGVANVLDIDGYYPYLDTGKIVQPILLVDMNGDSKDDLITGLQGDVDGRIYFIDLNDLDKGVKYYTVPYENSNQDKIYFIGSQYIDRYYMIDVVVGTSRGKIFVFTNNFFSNTIPTACIKINGSVRTIAAMDIDGDGLAEFAVGGSMGMSLLDYYHYLNLSVMSPENTAEIAYVNSNNITISWLAYCDIGIESYSILKNGTPIIPNIPPNDTSVEIVVDDGVWTIAITARTPTSNLRGNCTFLLVVDTVSPSIWFESSPDKYSNEREPLFVWNASDDLSGIDHYVFLVNGSLLNKTLPAKNNSLSFRVNTTALYNITIWAYDRAGNNASISKKIYFDYVSPDIFIEEPHRDSNCRHYINEDGVLVEVSWNCSDNLNISTILVIIDKNGEISVVPLSPYEREYYVSISGEGAYNVTIMAIDIAGNSNSDYVLIIADFTPPIIQDVSPTNLSAINRPTFEVTFVAVDMLSGINHTSVYVDNIFVGRIYNRSFGGIPVDLDYLNRSIEGTHNITIQIVDNAGNIASRTIVFIYDTTKPEARITSPSPGDVYGTQVEISWRAEDNLSGIVYVEVWIDSQLLYSKTFSIPQQSVSETNITIIDYGEHMITLVVVDNAGNYAIDEVTINVKRKTISTGLASLILVIIATTIITFATLRYFIKKKARRLEERRS